MSSEEGGRGLGVDEEEDLGAGLEDAHEEDTELRDLVTNLLQSQGVLGKLKVCWKRNTWTMTNEALQNFDSVVLKKNN